MTLGRSAAVALLVMAVWPAASSAVAHQSSAEPHLSKDHVPAKQGRVHCEPRVASLRERLGPPTAAPALSILESAIPEVDGGAPLSEPGVVINVQRSFPVVLDLENIQADGEAAGAIISRRVPRGRTLYVAAHRDESVARLLAILGPLRDRGAVHLVVRRPAPPPTEDVGSVVSQLTEAMGSCDAAMQVFRRVGGRLPHQRANFLREQLPPAVQQCRCEGVDVERLGTLVTMLVADEPALRAVPIALDDAGTRLPASATVADLARAAARAPAGRALTIRP